MIDPTEPAIRQVIDAASRKGVALEIRVLPPAMRTPDQVAMAVNAHPAQIVTASMFVAPRPGGGLLPIVCLASGRDQIDPALLAAFTGEFAIRAASAREVVELAGCAIDAIRPFGYGRDVRILMDQELCQYQWIWATAGSGGVVFRLDPRTLRVLANAVVAPLAAATWMTAPGAEGASGFRFETRSGT